jgi:hypothetical protein
VTPGLHSWPAPFTSPYLGYKPKVKVVTIAHDTLQDIIATIVLESITNV